MEKNSYKTKQKDLIVNWIKSKNNSFTINDIYDGLNKEVGLTTIYRLIDKLVKEGKVNKNINELNKPTYQYLSDCTCHNHFYLKCDNCGKLIHIDCECITELSEHILKIHKFIPNNKNIIINGICNKCWEENQ